MNCQVFVRKPVLMLHHPRLDSLALKMVQLAQNTKDPGLVKSISSQFDPFYSQTDILVSSTQSAHHTTLDIPGTQF